MKSEIIAGLDLGTTKVVCLIAKVKHNSTPEIVGVGVAKAGGVKNGIITSLKDASEAIKSAVCEAEQQASVKLTDLYTGIAGTHIKGENSRGVVSISHENGEITQEDVNQLIEQALSVKIPADREVIHAMPQEFIIDDLSGIKDPIGLTGSRLEGSVYIITGATSVIQNISKAINKAGFKVREFILQSVASSYAILDTDEMDLGCMVIDIGGGHTDGVIFQDGVIKETFTIPVGGIDVTNDISIGLGIPKQTAEEIKIKYGVARSELAGNDTIKIQKFNNGELTIEKRRLASIIAPRVEEIFGLVNRKLRYMDLDTLPSGIVLVGGTAKMRGIEGLAERIFGVEVKVGSVNNTIQGLNEEIKDSAYATAVGLIIYGVTHKNNKGMGKESRKPWISKLGKRLEEWLLK